MALQSRKPTGVPGYPLVVVEGDWKVGKTWAALSLASSERIGSAWVIEVGEATADAYAGLGDFEILEHSGTYTDILGQVEAAVAEPMRDGLPNLLVLDSASGLWGLIKAWAESRARRSRAGRKALADDPDAEIRVPMNLWTDAGDRWGRLVNLLRTWDGIAVLVAHGREVALVDASGNPVPGKTDYKVEGHKTLLGAVTAHVRVEPIGRARLMGAWGPDVSIPRGGLELPSEMPLEHLVFDVLGAGGFGSSSLVAPQVGRSVVAAKTELVELLHGDRGLAAEVWAGSEAAGLEGGDDVPDGLWAALMAAAAEAVDLAVPEPVEGGEVS